MKFIPVIALAFFSGLAYAQQPFQGTIVYNLHASMEKNDAELKLSFGPNKIKVQFKDKIEYDKTYLLIDLDSGKIFTLYSEDKKYTSKKLAETKKQETPPAPKTIAGYSTMPVIKSGNFQGLLPGLTSGNTTFHVANDLNYPIPEKYTAAPELMMIHNNHIILGADIIASPSFSSGADQDSSAQMIITVEAKQIEKSSLDISLFTIPADFEKRPDWMDMTAVDSAVIMPDSVVIENIELADTLTAPPPPPPPAKKKTGSVPDKKTSTKGEAIKPKKSQKLP